MRPEFIVAEKEFRDHLASKRFLAIFIILALLSFYGAYTGMDSYDKQLDLYKNPQKTMDDPTTKIIVESLQKQIDEARARGDPPQSIQDLKDRLKSITSPEMPSILIVFQGMILYFTVVGMFLGAMMGFDQISREKEEGSLKFLAISPLYRDAIINGKTIGAVATLAVALAAAFILAIAIAMFRSVLPGPDELLRIGAFYVAALFYCTVFFAIAMMISAILRNTSFAAICIVGLLLVIIGYTVLSMVVAALIAVSVAGPQPPGYAAAMGNSSNGTSPLLENKEYMNYTENIGTTTLQIADTMTTIAPTGDFGGFLGLGPGGIAMATLSTTPGSLNIDPTRPPEKVSLLDSLAAVWVKVLILLVYLVVSFAVSYVAFMRMDIR